MRTQAILHANHLTFAEYSTWNAITCSSEQRTDTIAPVLVDVLNALPGRYDLRGSSRRCVIAAAAPCLLSADRRQFVRSAR